VAALAASPHAAGLVAVDLGWNLDLGDVGAGALANSPHLDRLTTLRLGADSADEEGDTRQYVHALRNRLLGVTEAGARALAFSPTLAGLTHLDLGGQTLLGDAGVRTLAESNTLTRLATLRLCFCGIQGTGLKALRAAPFADKLTDLDLRCNFLRDEGAEALASVSLPNLRKLSLRYNDIGQPGVVALASSPLLTGLSHLDLIGNPLTDAGVQALAQSPHLTRLRSLRVTLTDTGRPGFAGTIGKKALLARFGKDVCGLND
jgi:hypothetical protein